MIRQISSERATRSAKAVLSRTYTARRTSTVSTHACSCWRDPSRSSLVKTASRMGRENSPLSSLPGPCTKSIPSSTACDMSPADGRQQKRPPPFSALRSDAAAGALPRRVHGLRDWRFLGRFGDGDRAAFAAHYADEAQTYIARSCYLRRFEADPLAPAIGQTPLRPDTAW